MVSLGEYRRLHCRECCL